MSISQKQLRHFKVDTIAEAGLIASFGDICYVDETRTFYVCGSLPTGMSVDNQFVLDGSSSLYWLGFSGQYVINSIHTLGDLSASKGFNETQTLGVSQTIRDNTENNVVVGDDAYVESSDSVVIGQNAGNFLPVVSPFVYDAVIIGHEASSPRGFTTVVGAYAFANRELSCVYGDGAFSGGARNVAIGSGAIGGDGVSNTDAVSIGANAYSSNAYSVAIGSYAYDFAPDSPGNNTVIGAHATVSHGFSNVALGTGASVVEQDRILQAGGNSTNLAFADRTGSFTFEEVIGDTSGARGIVIVNDQNRNWIKVENINDDDFVVGEVIIGQDSGAYATLVESVFFDSTMQRVFIPNTGSFEDGETVSGSTSGNNAVIAGIFTSFLIVENSVNNAFLEVGEEITGQTSSATATITDLEHIDGERRDTESFGEAIERVRFGRGINAIEFVNPIAYDNSTSGLSAETVKEAIDEIAGSAGGGGLSWQVQSTDTDVSSGIGYGCTEGVTLTLPENPSVGNTFGVKDVSYDASNDPIIINPNGRDIENSSDNLEIDVDGAGIIFAYFGDSIGWLQVSEASAGSSDELSIFSPTTIVSDDQTGLVEDSGSYDLVITNAMGNLIALDADVSPYDDITISVSAASWGTTDVGTFRLDIVVKSGQTIAIDGVEGAGDITLTPDETSSLLFDKPYGTDTWHVRQSV